MKRKLQNQTANHFSHVFLVVLNKLITNNCLKSKKSVLVLVFILSITLAIAGNPRYWVGGASANFSLTSSWSTTSGGASGASIPVSGDDVYFDTNSGSDVTVYCTGALSTLNSINMTSCNVTFAIVPAVTYQVAAGLITTGSADIALANTTGITAGASNVGNYVYVQSGTGAIPYSAYVSSLTANTKITLSTKPTIANTGTTTLAFVLNGTQPSISTKTMSLNNSNVVANFAISVNGATGNGTSTYDFSLLGNSTWTQASFSSGQTLTLGNGGTFYLTGNSASNYFDGNSNGYIAFNTTSTLDIWFNQTTIAGNGGVGGIALTSPQVNGWGGISNTRGTINIKNSVATQRINQSSLNSEKIVLSSNTTFNLTGNGSCQLGTAANAGYIDATTAGSKFIITSSNTGVLNAIGTIFSPGTASAPIDYLEFNRNSTFVPTAPLFVKNLLLTLGTIANSTTNSITVVNGGTITRTAGKLMMPPYYGVTGTDKVNVTINSTCTSDNELLGLTGKVGTLTVNPTFTYTLNSPSLAPGYYLSAFNGGNGYGGTAPTPSISGGTLASGTANTFTSPLYNGYLYSITSTTTGVYSSVPTITIAAPATPATWTASTAYTLNTVIKNGSNYYVCTTAGTSASSGGPTTTSTAKDGVIDNTAKWAYIGTSLATATASLSMLPTAITVDALSVSGKLSYPNSATPITLNVTNAATVNSGGTLNLGTTQGASVTHLLSVGGNLSNSGTFTTSITNGKLDVTLNGIGSQIIDKTATFNNLTVSKTAGLLSLNDNVTVNNNMTVNSQSAVTLASGKTLSVTGNLTLNSDINGTATFIDNNTSYGLTVTGTTSVNQYFSQDASGTRNWYVSSPVSGASATLPTGFTFYQYVEPGTNSDFSVLNSSAYWQGLATGTAYSAGRGYIALPASNGSATFTFNGTLNTTGNNITANLTNQGAVKTGFNLIGNPYPAHYTVTKAQTDAAHALNTIWYRTAIWDAVHSKYVYTYQTCLINADGTYTGSPNGTTNLIPPMQSFWVRTNTNNSTFTFNGAQLHQASNPLKVPTKNTVDLPIVRFQISNGIVSDETVIYANANASNSLDDYDGLKMNNNSASVPEIYTLVDGQQMVINGMNTIPYDTEIPLGFTTGTAGDFSIIASQISNLDPSVSIYLKDNTDLVNTPVQLTADAAYNFSSEVTTNNISRFSIIFKTTGSITGNITNKSEETNVSVYNALNNKIAVVIPHDTRGYYASVLNLVGQTIASMPLNGAVSLFDRSFDKGLYIVNISNGTKIISKTLLVY